MPPVDLPSPPRTAADWDALAREIDHLCDSDPTACLARTEPLLEQARAVAPRGAYMALLYLRAWSHLMLLDDVQAVSGMRTLREMPGARDEADWWSRATMGLAVAYASFGENDHAVRLYEEALVERRAAGDATGMARIMVNLALTLHELSGMQARALELLRQARALAVEHGDTSRASLALVNLAARLIAQATSCRQTEPVRTRALAQEGLDAAVTAAREGDESNYWGVAISGRIEAAKAALLLADGAQARRWMQDSERFRGSEANPFFDVERCLVQGQLQVHEGDAEAAVMTLEQGLAVVSQGSGGRRAEALPLLEALTSAHEQAGRLGDALACHRRFHRETMEQRNAMAERRALVLQAEMDLERARHAAELQRLRAEALRVDNERLAQQAQEDGLTGLANRRTLDDALRRWSAQGSVRNALALVDLDHFKQINDRFSHQTGDEVLRRVAALMRQSVRQQDLAARYGGEEFALLLVEVDAEQSMEICERLRLAVAAAPWHDLAPGLTVTASIGLGRWRQDDDATDLLARADTALYAAKRAGRNRTVVSE